MSHSYSCIGGLGIGSEYNNFLQSQYMAMIVL